VRGKYLTQWLMDTEPKRVGQRGHLSLWGKSMATRRGTERPARIEYGTPNSEKTRWRNQAGRTVQGLGGRTPNVKKVKKVGKVTSHLVQEWKKAPGQNTHSPPGGEKSVRAWGEIKMYRAGSQVFVDKGIHFISRVGRWVAKEGKDGGGGP